MLSEAALRELLAERLRKERWRVGRHKLHDRGPDIIASRDGATWVIECKGARQKVRRAFRDALGQIRLRMESRTAKYSIAVPAAVKEYGEWWSKLPGLAKHRTKVTCLFVNSDGTFCEEPYKQSSV